MGSPLSPVVANIYMEKFEAMAINSFPSTPSFWKRYVDDVLAKLSHGMERLEEFLKHLNNLSQHIKFTMEIEDEGIIPFLDVLFSKQRNEKLGYQVYRKKTHMDKYLHLESHHHPSQNIGIIHTLAIKASRISDTNHERMELEHLKKVFKGNGY